MGDQDGVEKIPEKLAQIETLLDEYEQRIGLNKLELPHGEPAYITREELLAMHPEDIDALRWEYASYALYLQKEINKHNSRYYWADHNLKRYIDKASLDYAGWWQERQALVMNNSIYPQKLDQLRLKSKLVIERTSFLTNKIAALDAIAKDITYAKRQQMRKENG